MKKILILIIFSLMFAGFVSYSAEKRSVNPKLPTVAVITTGGTIAEKVDPKTGGAVPALSGEALLEAVPELSKVANIKVVNFSNIDSSQMTPEDWTSLSKTVDNILKDKNTVGAVITHGTDTMAEGAFFLDLTLYQSF